MNMYESTLKGVDPMTEEDLVDFYLNLNRYWWQDPDNSLYGMREEAKTVINHWLRTGDDMDGIKYPLIYVNNHFQNDFMPHFRRVA